MTIARSCGWSNGRAAERFRFVEPVAHSGELGSIGRGGLIAERGMGPVGVVTGHPGGDDAAGVVETEEQRLVQ